MLIDALWIATYYVTLPVNRQGTAMVKQIVFYKLNHRNIGHKQHARPTWL